MTPQEKDLILSVFDRLAQGGGGPRDAEAESLINQRIVQRPDATYGLVQAVIIQEMSLNQAQQHIAELERQLAQIQGSVPAGGSFLGGSVPNSGARWGAQPSQPQYAPQPQYAQPQPAPQYAPQQPVGGGFMRNAATMAAGVAGGSLLAEGIASLFGGHRGYGGFGGAFGSPWGGQPGGAMENVTVNNYYGDQDGQGGQADAGYQDAACDDSSSFDAGGFDDSQDV